MDQAQSAFPKSRVQLSKVSVPRQAAASQLYNTGRYVKSRETKVFQQAGLIFYSSCRAFRMVKGRRSARKPTGDEPDSTAPSQTSPLQERQPHQGPADRPHEDQEDADDRRSGQQPRSSASGSQHAGMEQHRKANKEQHKKCYACGRRGHTREECHASRGGHLRAHDS